MLFETEPSGHHLSSFSSKKKKERERENNNILLENTRWFSGSSLGPAITKHI